MLFSGRRSSQRALSQTAAPAFSAGAPAGGSGEVGSPAVSETQIQCAGGEWVSEFRSPVVDGLKNMLISNFATTGKVRNGSGHLQNPVIGAGTEFEPCDRLPQQLRTAGGETTELLKFPA